MTARQQRMLIIGLVLAGVAIAAALALRAFNQNLMYFYSPTQVAAGEAPEGRRFRLGGLVTPGSMQRASGALELRFQVTDTNESLTVAYSGVLPDLFREGQGVIAYGVMAPDGSFHADEVLAKHDENYMPPEVADALQTQGHPGSVATETAP
jgi:cytochrome c-type biogenesis protein CcmE